MSRQRPIPGSVKGYAHRKRRGAKYYYRGLEQNLLKVLLMKKQNIALIFSLIVITIILVATYSKLRTDYIFPAEFERQQAVWLQWPEGQYMTGDQSVIPAFLSIIKALQPHIMVNIMSNSNDEIATIQSLLQENGSSGKNNISYYIINHFSIWARDVGPFFVKNRANRLAVADFGFNNYGKGASHNFIDVESNIHKSVAKILGIPLVPTELISEGGAVESNGNGTIMLTESVALNRNPKMTKAQIENEYKCVLGAKKVIWLKQGLAEDDLITKGHIDEIARFADSGTILLAQVLPDDAYTNSTSYASYLRMEDNYDILRRSTDQNGRPFQIVRIPMPPTLYQVTDETGKIPVRSYLNFVVTNGAVLIPSYWHPGRSDRLKTVEDQVIKTFRSLFSGREVIAVNVESINFWGGGIHCVTQQMPAV